MNCDKLFPRIKHFLGDTIVWPTLKRCFQICGSYWLQAFLQYLAQIDVFNQIYHLPCIVYSTVSQLNPLGQYCRRKEKIVSTVTIFWPDSRISYKKYCTREGEKLFVIVRTSLKVSKTWEGKNIPYVIGLDISSAPTSHVELFLQDGFGIWLISMSSCMEYFLHS